MVVKYSSAYLHKIGVEISYFTFFQYNLKNIQSVQRLTQIFDLEFNFLKEREMLVGQKPDCWMSLFFSFLIGYQTYGIN